jgi:hypothetical protein
VGGGQSNSATGSWSTVGGGYDNEAKAQFSFIGGGNRNEISEAGTYSVIPGGYLCSVDAEHSFAAGHRTWVMANHHGTFAWADHSDGAHFTSSGPDQFLIRAVGGVGIGTNAPTTQLHVVGAGDDAGGVAGDNSVVARFQTSAADHGTKVSIDSPSGYVSSLTLATDGQAQWDLSGYGTSFGLVYQGGSGLDQPVFSAYPGNRIDLYTSMEPISNDALNLGAASYRWANVYTVNLDELSDGRAKTDVSDLSDGLSRVLGLRPISFSWIDDEGSATNLGFIAQEVESVVPEAVSRSDDSDGTMGLHYSEIIPVLTKAIQEQQAEIEDLRARLEALER